jgi:hypothetical protein
LIGPDGACDLISIALPSRTVSCTERVKRWNTHLTPAWLACEAIYMFPISERYAASAHDYMQSSDGQLGNNKHWSASMSSKQ